MEYLINNTIKFSPEERRIYLQDEQDIVVELSNQASRLLMEFVKNSDTNLTREHLLKAVWEDFDMRPSINNLYTATSELRKAFSSLGVNDTIIKTIPRQGLAFTKKVEVIDGNEMESVPFTEKPTKKNKKIINYSLITMIIIMLSLIIHELINVRITPIEKEVKYIGKLDKCNIYSLDTQEKINDLESIKKTLVKNTNLPEMCNKGSRDIFFSDSKSKINITFIGSCISDQEKHTMCISTRVF